MYYWILEKLLILTAFAQGFSGEAGGFSGEAGGFSGEGVEGSGTRQTISISNPLGEGATIQTLLYRIIDFLAYELGPIIVVGFVVYAAFLFITAAGDKAKVDLAKKTLTYVIVGYMILLLADGLVFVIQDVLLGSSAPTNNSQ